MSTKSNIYFFKMISHFSVVAYYGQIKKAAEILNLQQTNLSHEIQELENYLNTQLIVKSNRGIILTDEGKLLLSKTKLCIDTIEKIQEIFKIKHDKKSVCIRMPSAGIVALQNQITEFKKNYPEVLCNFIIHEIPEYSTLNDIDIYATYSHHIWNNTDVLLTGSQKFACVCSKSYLKKYGVPNSLYEMLLERHLCICPSHLKYDPNYVRNCEMAKHLDFKVSNFTVIISLVLSRDIIAVVPKYMTKIFPELVCLDIPDWSLSLPNKILVNKDTICKEHVKGMARCMLNLYKEVEKSSCFENLKINEALLK
jgi:DNA-binding transcriptional LysR family regulator